MIERTVTDNAGELKAVKIVVSALRQSLQDKAMVVWQGEHDDER